MARTTPEQVEAQLLRLATLDRDGLIDAWGQAYGAPPPKKTSRDLLMKGIAYHIQCEAYGGLQPATRTVLERIAAAARSSAAQTSRASTDPAPTGAAQAGLAPTGVAPTGLAETCMAHSGPARASLGRSGLGRSASLFRLAPPALRPGSRLIRVFGGETHAVEVTEDGGFRWQGQDYASLSMIARAITGTRRNGPAFFGLRETPAIARGPMQAGSDKLGSNDRRPRIPQLPWMGQTARADGSATA